jgi:hypothetical protein
LNNVQLLEMSKKIYTKSNRGPHEIILFNDDRITFDHVVDCLMSYCDYNELQAYQCAIIVDTAGQCSIYTDTYDECIQVSALLNRSNLKTIVKKYKKK